MSLVKYVKVTDYFDGSRKVVVKGGYLLNVKKIQEAKQRRQLMKAQLFSQIERLANEINQGISINNKDKQISFMFDDKVKRDKYYELVDLYSKEFTPKLYDALRSLRRAKQELFDILKNNDFDYFLTLTFDKRKVDRLNDDLTRKKFSKWCNNVKSKLPNMTYVAVLEYHKKGGLHYHVLVGNVTSEDLKLVDSGKVVKAGKCAGSAIYNVGAWKIGFSTATKVYDKDAVKYYISKYLTKGGADPRFFGKKRFYVSQNILRPQVNKFTVKGDFDIEATFDLDTYNIDYRNKDKDYMILSKRIANNE